MDTRIRKFALLGTVAAVAGFASAPAHASLSTFQQYVGSYDVSTDGFGSTSQAGVISANVPAGATVVAAYLYSSMYFSTAVPGGTLNGTAVNYSTQLGLDPLNCCTLQASRADVTSIVKPVIDGGPGGVYDFRITETDSSQDGEGLVVVYNLASLPTQTIGILDGFSKSGGDSSSITFGTPLDPTAAGFVAEMFIGDGFSYDNNLGGHDCSGSGQVSTILVNGLTLTDNAGCNDDSADGTDSNGNLITVGSFDDPLSPALPSTADDHEHYDLAPFITLGDTVINLSTNNPSNDDNIFLEVFRISGEGVITCPDCVNPSVPEPGTLALLGSALVGFGALRRRAKRKA